MLPLLLWGLVAAPFALCLWFVERFSVDVPWGDNWMCIRMLESAAANDLSWSDVLFYQVNQHVVGVPYACMIELARLTHYDVRAGMLASAIILLAGAGLVVAMAKKRLAKGLAAPIALIPISFLACTLRHYENLLSGQLEMLMSSSAFVLTIYLLDQVEGLSIALPLAMVSAAISTFSFGNGVLSLPIGLLLLVANLFFLKKERAPNKWLVVLVWFLFSALLLRTYFSSYVFQPASKPDVSASPFNTVFYALTYLGGPLSLSFRPDIAAAMGSIVVVIAGVYLVFMVRARVKPQPLMIAPAMLVLYTIASDLLTSFGRAMQGPIQATSSRYVAFSYVGIAGLFMLLLVSVELPRRLRFALLAAMVAVVSVGSVMSIADGLEQGNTYRERDIKLAGLVKAYRYQDLESLSPLWVRPYIWEARHRLIPFLELNRMSVFRQPQPKASWRPAFPPVVHIDGIVSYAKESANNLYIYHVDDSKTKYLNVSGWCVDQASRRPAGGAVLCFDQSIELPAAYGLDRPEVESIFKRGSYRRSGFTATFLTDSLGPGQHTLALKVMAPDGKSYYRTAPLALLNIYDSKGAYFDHAGRLLYSLSAPKDAGGAGSNVGLLQKLRHEITLDRESFYGDGLTIYSRGAHPQILLPPIEADNARGLILKLSLTAPANTRMHVAYKTASKAEYTWEQSIQREVVKGENNLFVMLPGFIAGRLRIELGNCPGTYVVHDVEIKSCR